MAVVIALLVFIITAAIVLAIAGPSPAGSGIGAGRMRDLFPSPDQNQSSQRTNSRPRTDMMPTITRFMKGRQFTGDLVTELSAAGLPIRPSEFIGIVGGSLVLSQILAMLLVNSVLGYLVFAIIGVGIPIWTLRHLQEKRRTAFNNQIADALLLMASSLRSGFSFMRGMQMVAQEMPPPIAKEFERVVNEVNVGRPMEDALRSVVARVQSYDFDLVVTAVLIQQQVGGNLADILDTIAATMRDRARVMGEVKALTAEGRISGVVLVMMPVFLGVVMEVLNPNYMAVLFRETLGHYLIGTAVVLQILGGLIIRKMLVLDI